MSDTPVAKKPTIREKLQALVDEYGPVVLGVWVALALATFFGFWGLIEAGLDLRGYLGWFVEHGWISAERAETSGTAAIACVGLQTTKPLRFLLTALLVPYVARLRRRRGPE